MQLSHVNKVCIILFNLKLIKSQQINVYIALRCQDGEVKLVGGSTLNEGQVEVCINETWSAICNNHSDLLDATLCRQLGYSNYGK